VTINNSTPRVAYINSGRGCLLRLFLSLYTLRQHYGGGSVLFYTPDCKDEILELAALFGTDVHKCVLPIKCRHPVWTCRPRIYRDSPYPYLLALDADTIILDNPQPLLDAIPDYDVTLAHWITWYSDGKRIRRRTNAFHKIVSQNELHACQRHYPAVNGGVMGLNTQSPFMNPWVDLTEQSGRLNLGLNDEVAAQILYPRYNYKMFGPEWNCSLKYGNVKEARILHAHGRCSFSSVHTGARKNKEKLIEAFGQPEYKDIIRRFAADDKQFSKYGGVGLS